MRILFWSETFWPRIGGVENLAARLLPALQFRGYEFAVVTWENIAAPDDIRYRGIPVYRFPFFSGGHRGSLDATLETRRRVAQLKQEFAPQLIHVNSYGRSVFFHLNTPGAYRVPMLVTLHQALPEAPVSRDSLLGHLLRTANWVNTCSNAVLTRTRELVPELIPCSSVIYNGLEAPRLGPRPIPFDPPRLVCLGRLVPEKGFDLALTAFRTVLDRFPDARLILAGDGPEREKLERQAIDLGLSGSVEFTGCVSPDAVFDLITEATLVLAPSRLEGFGLVALEAQLMARPVVATRIGGLPEVVAHGLTGLIVESENSQLLAEAVVLLLNDPEKATDFGRTGRARALEKFGWDRHLDAYDKLYRRVARVGSGGGSFGQAFAVR